MTRGTRKVSEELLGLALKGWDCGGEWAISSKITHGVGVSGFSMGNIHTVFKDLDLIFKTLLHACTQKRVGDTFHRGYS